MNCITFSSISLYGALTLMKILKLNSVPPPSSLLVDPSDDAANLFQVYSDPKTRNRKCLDVQKLHHLVSAFPPCCTVSLCIHIQMLKSVGVLRAAIVSAAGPPANERTDKRTPLSALLSKI